MDVKLMMTNIFSYLYLYIRYLIFTKCIQFLKSSKKEQVQRILFEVRTLLNEFD